MEKTDEQILFAETEIDGIKVKPWSFGMLFEISDLLNSILDKMEEKNVSFDMEFISYNTLARIFALATPEVLKIMSLTLEKEEEELKKLPMGTGIRIAYTIYSQNAGIIKNELTPAVPEENVKAGEEN